MIKHIKCDIFESGADLILHQVNCQGAMNSGVAKQVREKYPNVIFCGRRGLYRLINMDQSMQLAMELCEIIEDTL